MERDPNEELRELREANERLAAENIELWRIVEQMETEAARASVEGRK